ncbi:hypothetical protein [Achromobacter sp. DH1f]|uniref:hypothetical protein n=1 Tax=Achromobacter sp. DH1f TaxID=1397275 RepID=UPI000469351F|nr:hypothetical protein [Achromobacter sp. DH1f]
MESPSSVHSAEEKLTATAATAKVARAARALPGYVLDRGALFFLTVEEIQATAPPAPILFHPTVCRGRSTPLGENGRAGSSRTEHTLPASPSETADASENLSDVELGEHQ